MLRRKAYDRLLEWKSREGHRCLLVKGQRQVGKTFIIDAFARANYGHYAYLDLSMNVEARRIFERNLDVDTMVSAISLYADATLVPGDSLVFLDEIQSCPRAREALKAFSLDGRYDVIASGSLVDAVGFEESEALIPVGYEEHMTMHSLDFEEFLWANGGTEESISLVRGCIRDRTPIPEPFLNWMNDRFRDFMMVGGMPAAVVAFTETGQYSDAGIVLDGIILSTKGDMQKYNGRTDRVRIEECFDSIPGQLSETNKRFLYSRIDGSGSRNAARRYADGLLWIKRAGIGNLCYALREMSPPLWMRRRNDLFKVYMSDTGMLLHMMGRTALKAVYEGDVRSNQGALMENVVAECLMKSGIPCYYYRQNKGEGMMELDFVVELGTEVAVIEVKSGRDRESPSIGKVARFHRVDRRIVFERSNIRVDGDGMEHYPLFAAAFTDAMERPWDGPALRSDPPPVTPDDLVQLGEDPDVQVLGEDPVRQPCQAVGPSHRAEDDVRVRAVLPDEPYRIVQVRLVEYHELQLVLARQQTHVRREHPVRHAR